MCGITGVFAFNLVGKFSRIHLNAATNALSSRGPDHQNTYADSFVALGHRRLSIIDTRDVAHQPMWDEEKRYSIVFNGEIFNFQELREQLEQSGVTFFSNSDTEVLLKLFIKEKENCLQKLNGFFAFCIYDLQEQSFFIARDQFGIKPLLYLFDEDKFLFASEMKALLQYGIDKSIDYSSLYTYLQLNYTPAPDTIFQKVKKLMPGHFLTVKDQQLSINKYYEIPYDSELAENTRRSFGDAKLELTRLLESSVKKRLIADVPLGCFLSGGIDSSVVTALASRHKPDLKTFSIGFKDEPFFDETSYAEKVAKKFNTDHTVFSLTNNDLYAHVRSILDYIDEPFADSSAIAVYILSKEARRHATVALSGDGADELLAGYNKHDAFRRALAPGWKEDLVSLLHPLWHSLPSSRNNPVSNKIRQLLRFSDGMKRGSKERYWRWAGYTSEDQVANLIHPDVLEKAFDQDYEIRKSALLNQIPENETINDILLTDMKLVLSNDMLTKVDLMSMANGLEVRVPYLDYEVVNFIFSLPASYKIDSHIRKKILQEAFRDVLPVELYNRAKKGFEVPLLKWLRNEMRSLIMDDLLSREFVESQRIFRWSEIQRLKDQLFSSNPGDIAARIWGLVVFQSWWKKMMLVDK